MVAHASSRQGQPKKDFSNILFDFIIPESERKQGNYTGRRFQAMMVFVCLIFVFWLYRFTCVYGPVEQLFFCMGALLSRVFSLGKNAPL